MTLEFPLLLALLAFIFTLIATPVVRDYCQAQNVVDRNAVERNTGNAIPRTGGVAIVLAYLLAFVVADFTPWASWASLNKSFSGLQAIFLGTAVVFLFGLLDDIFDLRPWQKLVGQLLAASIVYFGGVQIHFVPETTFYGAPLNFILTISWLVTCSNAFNLIDGLDGLAAGVGLFATVTTMLASLIHQNAGLLIVTAPLAGALLGFLRYNFNPASIFLGDCGSLTTGFLLGCFAIEWSHKSVTLLGMTAPLMAITIPLLDTALSIARRFLRHKPIFSGDRGHIHHRLLDLGLNTKQAVLIIYGVSGVAAALSLLMSKVHGMNGNYSHIVILLFCAVTWIGIQHLGYVEFGMMRQLFLKGTLRRIIDSQTRLDGFVNNLSACQNLEECWKVVEGCAKEFGFEATRAEFFGRRLESGNLKSDVTIQLRLDLRHNNYLNLYYSQSNRLDSVMLNSLLTTMATKLDEKLTSLAPATAAPLGDEVLGTEGAAKPEPVRAMVSGD